MVKVSRKEKKSKVTKALISWLQREEPSVGEQLRAVTESQKTLLFALRAMIGDSKIVDYELLNGHRVRLQALEDLGFTLEFMPLAGQNKAGAEQATEFYTTDLTARELYDLYFPDPAPSESELDYHIRLLAGLDLLTDQLAMGRPVGSTAQ